ncbi:hypothetical protein [Streptomyces sp. NPDC059787]|uniref:hypothetical protein n=1 Tax=Streptomyces sp. NPDC059787 TaxID=3346947 RepID=UPI00364E055C
MNLAPLPEHGRTGRPEWLALWQQYEPVTTPLRAAGLVCDIDTCGGQTVIYVDLPDGTHLVIGCGDDSLPDRLRDVTGWIVTREHRDNPTFHLQVFDSTEDGEHGESGGDVVAMLAGVALHLKAAADADTQAAGTRLGALLLATAQRFAVEVTGVTAQHTGNSRKLSGPFNDHREAVKDYGWQTHLLEEQGWQMVHEHGGADWPVTVWQRRGATVLVFVSRQSLL